MVDERDQEAKFLKSGQNRRTENAGLAVLLRDPRHQVIPVDLKKLLLRELGVVGPHQAFDAIRLPEPGILLTALNISQLAPSIRLVEMKTTRKPIRDVRLQGFFFGVTESEMKLADALGDHYVFAFVVLNTDNVFAQEFFVLLTADQLRERIHSQRTQYQVTLTREIRELSAPYGTGPEILVEQGKDLPIGPVATTLPLLEGDQAE